MKKVGIEFVAENAQQFEQTLNTATEQTQKFTESTENAAKLAEFFSSEWQKVFFAFKQIGEAPQTALDTIRAATEENINPTDLLKKVNDLLFESIQRVTEAGGGWVEIQKAMADWSGKTAQEIDKLRIAQEAQVAQQKMAEEANQQFVQRTHQIVEAGVAFGASTKEIKQGLMDAGLSTKDATNLMRQYGIEAEEVTKVNQRISESAVQTSRAFFALTLASFGLMTITRQLKEAGETELAPTLEKITNAVQIIASFGSAGAFVGGVPGALIGGGIGGLLALPELMDKTSQATKDLIQQLDQLGRKDDVVATIARLAGVTDDLAEKMLKAAADSPQLQQALENIARAQKDVENAGTVTAGIGAGIGARDLGVTNALFAELVKRQKEAAEAGLELAQAELQVQMAVTQVHLANKPFMDQLDAFAKKDDFSQKLQEWGNLTKADAEDVEKLLKLHPEWAEQLKTVATRIDTLQASQSAVKGHTEEYTQSIENQKGVLSGLLGTILTHRSELEKTKDVTEQITRATESYSNVLRDTTIRLGQLNERTQQQYNAAQDTFNDTVTRAARERQQAIERSEEQLTDRLAGLWQDLQDRISDINHNLAQKIEDINHDLAQKIGDINHDLAQRISDIQQDLADKQQDIQVNLAQRLSDIDQNLADRTHDIQARLAEQRIQIARDTSMRIEQIERQRNESLAALDFNTHEQLLQAKTRREEEDILRRALFDRGQINIRANDQLSDLFTQQQLRLQTAQDTADRELEIARREAEQARLIALREAEERRRIAEREALENIARAEREAADKLDIAEREAADRRAIAEREAADAIELAKRRYTEETKAANDAYAEQVKLAKQAEADKLADARDALNDRNKAIAQSYQMERDQIEQTRQKAWESYVFQLVLIEGLGQAMIKIGVQMSDAFRKIFNNLTKLSLGLINPNWIMDVLQSAGQIQLPPLPPIPQFGNVPTESTFAPLERTTQLLTGGTTNHSNNTRTYHFNIYDATDPVKVRSEVARYLEDQAYT